MANWKIVISEPETRKSFQLELDQDKAMLVGKKIGDEFSGDMAGLNGYSLKITGGSDKDGFPMHPDVEGMGKRRVLLSDKPCFHPKLKGQRKRKTVRGNVISQDIAQINCKVVKKGEKPLEELVPMKPKEPKTEEPEKEKAEEKPKTEPKDTKTEAKAEEPKKEKADGGEAIQKNKP